MVVLRGAGSIELLYQRINVLMYQLTDNVTVASGSILLTSGERRVSTISISLEA